MTSASSAAATGLPTFTRRGIAAALGATPAAFVAGASAIAAAHPDAALLALREPYERTLAGAEAVSPDHSAAEEVYYAAKERHPDIDRVALERMSGLDVAEERWQSALDLNSDVIGQIIDTPARTLEGLIFKARICERESMHADLAEAIVADLVAMGGAHCLRPRSPVEPRSLAGARWRSPAWRRSPSSLRRQRPPTSMLPPTDAAPRARLWPKRSTPTSGRCHRRTQPST